MKKKWTIRFVEASSAITERVTKFGGQPVWHSDPQWPLSRATGSPMQFICQIAIRPEFQLTTSALMAYLFMTDEDVDGTWEPDGGENAVILQPGATSLPISAQPTGPILYEETRKHWHSRAHRRHCEYQVLLTESDDFDFVPEEELCRMSDEAAVAAGLEFSESKIAGTPVFIQGDEFPFDGGSQLLLQLDANSSPFFINFGDSGVGYAFLNSAGDEAKFLWQN